MTGLITAHGLAVVYSVMSNIAFDLVLDESERLNMICMKIESTALQVYIKTNIHNVFIF